MDDFTPDQARALWEAGGFLVFTGLPEGSEFGIDGTFHIVRRFSGIKFLPPGLHMITWSPPLSSSGQASAGPSSLPIRSAMVRYFRPKERVVLSYDRQSETVVEIEIGRTVEDDRLRALDGEMAAYPFEGVERWKGLSGLVDEQIIRLSLGESEGRVDGLTPVQGEEEEVGDSTGNSSEGKAWVEGEKGLKFPIFNMKRSWRDGAVGQEVTRYSKDKSWLFGHVVREPVQLGGDPLKLVAYLQLAFLLLLYLSSYSALMTYRRLLSLLTQSLSLLISPAQYSLSPRSLLRTYVALVTSLAAQIVAIPDGTFETELPDLDVFYLDSIESLRVNLVAGLYGDGQREWQEIDVQRLRKAWEELRGSGKRRWDWEIAALVPSLQAGDDSDEEDEEGEYAPVVVER